MITKLARCLQVVTVAGMAALTGCSDATPAASRPDGGSGAGSDSGPAQAGAGAGSGGAGGQAGGAAGEAASDAGSDAGVITGSGSPRNPWIAFIQVGSNGFGQLEFVKADGTGLTPVKGAGTEYETDPSWSPDGTQLAFVQLSSQSGNVLHILDFTTGRDRAVTTNLAQLTRPRWAPDGKTLVVAGTASTVPVSALFRVDLASGTTEQITQPVNGDGGHDFAPDGTLYFVRHLDAMLFDVFSVPYTAEPKVAATRVTTDSKVLGGVSVHPSGERIFYAQERGTTTDLIELTLATGKKRVIGQPGDQEPRSFVAGDKLVLSRASLDADSEIAVVDENGSLLERCTTDADFDVAPAVSPLENGEVDLSPF